MDPDLLLNKREDTGRGPDTGVPQCSGSETLLGTYFSPIIVVIPCSFSDVFFLHFSWEEQFPLLLY
jgi:hypothetical protein